MVIIIQSHVHLHNITDMSFTYIWQVNICRKTLKIVCACKQNQSNNTMTSPAWGPNQNEMLDHNRDS